MASAPLRKQAGPVAATDPAGVPAVHKAAPQGADAHGGCRTRCALRRHAAPRGRAESGAGSGQQANQGDFLPAVLAERATAVAQKVQQALQAANALRAVEIGRASCRERV